jgi:hypothetical protein
MMGMEKIYKTNMLSLICMLGYAKGKIQEAGVNLKLGRTLRVEIGL